MVEFIINYIKTELVGSGPYVLDGENLIITINGNVTDMEIFKISENHGHISQEQEFSVIYRKSAYPMIIPTYYPLPLDGSWTIVTLAKEGSKAYFFFDAITGQSYDVQWDDSYEEMWIGDMIIPKRLQLFKQLEFT